MAIGTRLEFRQSQSLVMTPQLLQSIKLLQMSNLELTEFVDAEIEKNPLLECDEQEPGTTNERRDEIQDAAGVAEMPDQEPSIGTSDSGEWMQTSPSTDNTPSSSIVDSSTNPEMENVFPDDPQQMIERASGPPQSSGEVWQPAGGSAIASGEAADIEAYVASKVTLRDHLGSQIMLAGLNKDDALIAAELLDRTDTDGYIRTDLDALAAQLGVEIEDVEAIIAVLQGMEPPGICARNLEECLAIQLSERDRLDPAMRALVQNLDLLAKRDFPSLEKICAVDREDLVDMMQEIQALDPKPGRAFDESPVQAVVPDVLVREAADGSWQLELNHETLPRVLVNRVYFAEVSPTLTDEKEKAFLVDCLQNANWLTKSLDQRAQTILKVSAEIVAQQDGFLTHGIRHLKPLNLKAVADAIKMHESTVSRVTSNKYMMTPRGLFELKYFFTTAISASDGGEALSSEAVRDQIRTMIDTETAEAVLSDDAIVARLKNTGVDIARRTVAKYRDAMNIPSSVQRRREKRALAAHGGNRS